MMHRLHFEEAPQSSFAITPARAGDEVRDENESQSLAAEFQSLLAQLAGQIAAVPDQGAAIGFALAQTAVPQRLKAPEDASSERAQASNDEQYGEVAAESRPAANSTLAGTVDERPDSSRERSSYPQEQADREGVEGKAQSPLTEANRPSCNAEAQDVACDQVPSDATGDKWSSATTGIDGGQPLMQQQAADEVADAGAIDREIAHQQGDSNTAKQVLGETIRAVQAAGNQSCDKSADDDGIALDPALQAIAAQIEENGNTREISRNIPHQQLQQQVLEGHANMANSQLWTSQQQTGDEQQSGAETGEQRRADADDSLLGQRQRSNEVAKSVVSDVTANVLPTPEPMHVSDVLRGEVRSDRTIQMAILRQAFESLRVERAEAADPSRLKLSTQAVQSPGSAAEVKSSQSESSSRAKALTRPQIGRMLERVETTLKEAARGRDGKTISLHLEPVDLGKVKVDVSLREGTLHARISPDNQQVAQALREHAHELQGALRKLGLEVDSVTVSVTTDDCGGEMNTGQQTTDGRSFHDDRNNVPFESAQLADTTIGNELALRSKAGASSERQGAASVTDHWIA
jgi:hypothetical protein